MEDIENEIEEKTTFCPMIRNDCLTVCKWFSAQTEQCAIKTISHSLDRLSREIKNLSRKK